MLGTVISNFQPSFGGLPDIRECLRERLAFRDATRQSGNLSPEAAFFGRMGSAARRANVGHVFNVPVTSTLETCSTS